MEELKILDDEIRKIEIKAKDLYNRLYENSNNVSVFEIMEGIMRLYAMEILIQRRDSLLVKYN